VTSVVQHAVQLLVVAATHDPGECFVPSRNRSDAGVNGSAELLNGNRSHGNDSAAASTKSTAATAAPAPATGTAPAKTLDVEDAKFFVVKATAESLELLSEYLAVVINLEIVVTDVMARIIEFLKVSALVSSRRYFRTIEGLPK
jgi:vacuolar protein sorting-associated protein 54